MWSVSDERSARGMAAGDPDAAAAFVARFQRRVFGLARTITGDDTLAEDVAQEALLRAWRHGGRLRPAARQRRDLAADDHPEPRDRPGPGAAALGRSIPTSCSRSVLAAPGPGPAEAAIAPRTSARLRAALAGLPPEQRRAIVLAGVLGLSGREVAEAEEIPLGHGEDPDPHRDAPPAGGRSAHEERAE